MQRRKMLWIGGLLLAVIVPIVGGCDPVTQGAADGLSSSVAALVEAIFNLAVDRVVEM